MRQSCHYFPFNVSSFHFKVMRRRDENDGKENDRTETTYALSFMHTYSQAYNAFQSFIRDVCVLWVFEIMSHATSGSSYFTVSSLFECNK